MIHVLLKGPTYYCVVLAGTKKHFELEDSGFVEIESGSHDEMYELQRDLEGSSSELIQLYCEKRFSLIQTTEDCLLIMLDNDPDYLNDKEFI